MSVHSHKDTEALQHLADEVEQERATKGRTPFDDIPESEGGDPARQDGLGNEASQDSREAVERAEAFGAQGRPQTPGL
ncbi:hypothetical protein [Demequina activiva]|uniref:Uncharacterized protein n=1 Tax=Demequina activiva TaxID=1582364 RepID=A0A919Q7Z4_9MICO|nr:hypothetical protein [Demequina activiva]GIG55445.1 hypothetical protein Dac01nite_21970 [Demequina activiva]